MLFNKKLSGLLGLAQGANKIVYGEIAQKAIADKKSKLLLISDKASDRTVEKLVNRAKYYKKPYQMVDDDILNHSTGKANKKYLLILDEGFSKAILELYRKR